MFSTALPEPILFHPLKHHLGHIVAYIQSNKNTPVSSIRQDLITLGTSQLDLYCGLLPPLQVAQEVISYLQHQHLITPESYKQHLLAVTPHYQCVTLSDTTDWVLQWGVVEDRFVHLHPARYAEHTIRVKSTALKTAIVVAMASQRQQTTGIDLDFINRIRYEWIGLAPIKHFNMNEGAGKILTRIQHLL